MDVNTYTLFLIDNYIEATGQGMFRRASLTPEEYLLFRKQAEEECKYTLAGTNIVPTMSPTQITAPIQTSAKMTTEMANPLPKPQASVKQPVSSYTDYEDSYEEEEEDSMEALLLSIPG